MEVGCVGNTDFKTLWDGPLLPCEPERNAMKTQIMHIEDKGGGLAGRARIVRVRLSDSGKTIYYNGQSFQSLKGQGYIENTGFRAL